MKRYILALPTLLFLACSSTPPEFSKGTDFVPTPVTKIYQADYEYAWKAALAEMNRFPLKVVNKDAGTITTDRIFVISDRYESQDSIKELEPRGEIKYYIDVNIRALSPVNSIPQTEVSVIKYISRLSQLGTSRPLKSDYLDEKVIMHRIKRLLELERLKIERNRK